MAPKRPRLDYDSDCDIEIIELPRKKTVCQPTPARTPATPSTPARTPTQPVIILDDDDDDLEVLEVRSIPSKRPTSTPRAPSPAPPPTASPALIYANNAVLLNSARRAILAPTATPSTASRRVGGVHTLANLPDYNTHFDLPPEPIYSLPAAAASTPVRRTAPAPITRTPTTAPRSQTHHAHSLYTPPLPRTPASPHLASTPTVPTPRRPPASNRNKDSPTYRPKRFRPHCPAAVAERLSRALSQRLIVLSRSGYSSATHSETFTMAGTTGNVYTIRICSIPTCDCPDAGKGNTCKHLLYIMARVLGAREELVYQAGLTREELEEIFSRAGTRGTGVGVGGVGGVIGGGSGEEILGSLVHRKPISAEDPCPICFSEITTEELENEELLYCKAQCGANVHKECFGFWRRTKGADVTCVLCRQPWIEEYRDGMALQQVLDDIGGRTEEGYINVARELGISGVRDTSSYHAGPGGFTRRGRERYGWRAGLF